MYFCDEMLFSIFEYLEIGDILNTQLVSKQFDNICNDNILWKRFFKRDYNKKCWCKEKRRDKSFYDRHYDDIERGEHKKNHICLDNNLYKKKYIKYCSIKKIKEITGMLISINYLYYIDTVYVRGERIEYIPEQICELDNMSTFHFSCNGLKVISEGLCKLINLKSLELNTNRIMEIPDCIEGLVNLERISIRNNKIEKISNNICKLIKIKNLDVHYNNIYEIPKDIGNLINLRSINFSKNRITKIPEGIGKLKILENCNLACNNISYIPDEIGQLINLNNLSLRQNALQFLPSIIGDMKKLRELDISNNRIDELPVEITNSRYINLIILNSSLKLNIGYMILGNNKRGGIHYKINDVYEH